MKRRGEVVLMIAFVLVVAACGGNDSTSGLPGQATAATLGEAADSTQPLEPSVGADGAISRLTDARGGVVQIVAKGTFVDPFDGVQANVPGAGSGFIIDPSGLAVTNNHVVTGAALLEVYLDGEESPRNAHVVAVSECSDLAVIDIQGEGYPYFEWFEGEITTGLEIFAAGFPLGESEYTLLDGIVSKERVDGETNWASVDAVIEHSADTLPGNSGGPILTADGKIVAVNYAGNDLGQSFAIGREVARPVVTMLAAGESVNSIGVNGEALLAGTFSGIWVYSVESGAAADRAGVEPGDLLVEMEGLDLGVDGTMSEYCDILRSHQGGDTLAVSVYRNGTGETLEGQLNGRILEPVFSLSGELDEVVEAPPAGSTGPDYADYYQANDDTGAITVNVPVEWFESDGRGWVALGDGTPVGPALTVTPNLEAYNTTWSVPGLFIGASDQLGVNRAEFLNQRDFSESCTFIDRLDYDDGAYFGEFDVWENCGFAGSTLVVIVAEPAGGEFIVLAELISVGERDFAALDEVIATFLVDPELGGY